ncbi:MAG TPA: glycosyltransferase [Phaeodactylibacter sp.]|nr:glycosyltransferase [Phaeodactylibacter sp.]
MKTKPLKIAILSPAHPLRGGIAASSERLAREWMASGAEVKIYSYKLQYPKLLFPGKTQYTNDPAPEGLHIQPLLNSVWPPNWWKTGRLLAREKPDILLLRYWMPFFAPALGSICRKVKKNKHTRIVCIADNIIPHEHRPGDQALTRYFIKTVDAFVVMSRSVGKELESFDADKPWKYVPHPVYDHYGKKVSRKEACTFLNLEPFGKCKNEHTRYILFFGFIRKYKGLDILINSMADARLRKMPVKLLVAGEFYEDEKKYRELVSRLGLEDKIIFRNEYIPQDEVRYYFGAADIVAQPYRSATQSGISQLACHFEKPMLVTRVGGLPEIVPHGKAGYVTDVSAPAVAEALVDFFENNRAAEMEAFVKEYKKQFSWSTLAKTIEQL